MCLDESELRIGDHLLQSIDEGLTRCDYGVVILSPSFFAKQSGPTTNPVP